MEDLGFCQMQAIQRELQEKYKHKWPALNPVTGKDKLLWLMIELAEAADIMKKDGVQAIMDEEDVRAHFIEELVDVMMYFNDVLIAYDIPVEAFKAAYLKKHARNMQRWSAE